MNNRLKQINFQDFPKIAEDKENITNFLIRNKLDNNGLEAILAYLATLNKFSYTDEGLINPKPYIRDNFTPDDWHKGLYTFLMKNARGDIILGRQIDREYLPFCALVPLFLAAHKKYNNIPYNKWSKEGLHAIVPPMLDNLMQLKGKNIHFDPEYLVTLRDTSLLVKSGKTQGSYRNPKTFYGVVGLNKLEDVDFVSLPKLSQMVLIQTWAAHPDNRNEYMVLDINDWDNMPKALEESKLFTEEEPKPVTRKKKESTLDFNTLDLPWKF